MFVVLSFMLFCNRQTAHAIEGLGNNFIHCITVIILRTTFGLRSANFPSFLPLLEKIFCYSFLKDNLSASQTQRNVFSKALTFLRHVRILLIHVTLYPAAITKDENKTTNTKVKLRHHRRSKEA